MARNNYSYEKRLRELEKQKKRREKLEKKTLKKEEEGTDAGANPAASSLDEGITPED